MKTLMNHSHWKCKKCGFTADGRTWNLRWLRDYGLWGAIYSCPNCKNEVTLTQA